MPDSAQITAWLALWRNGDEHARERLFETVHIQLRQIAANLLQRERANHTREATALVNELCVRLLGSQIVSYQVRAHFFASAAQAMRRILIDHARVVELRFFAGLQEGEVAVALDVSEITVKRDWKAARAWLISRLHSR